MIEILDITLDFRYSIALSNKTEGIVKHMKSYGIRIQAIRKKFRIKQNIIYVYTYL